MDIQQLTQKENQLKESLSAAEAKDKYILEQLEEMRDSDDFLKRSELLEQLIGSAREISRIHSEIFGVQSQIIEHESLYRRPNDRLSRWFSTPLGPTPEGMRPYSINDQVIASMPKYRWQSVLLLAFIVTCLLVMVPQWPWLAVSPFVIAIGMLSGEGLVQAADSTVVMGSLNVVVISILGVVLGMVLRNPKSMRNFAYRAALSEEQWFRSGAEKWTFKQRVASCVMFGLFHLPNLIYPISIILLLMVAGVVLMRVYLNEYSRTQNTYMATMAATSFHATYNIYAFWFMVVMAALSIVSWM